MNIAMIQGNAIECRSSGGSAPRALTLEEPIAVQDVWLSALIASRHNVSPKRLDEPSPDEAQLDEIFRASAAAPDHGQIGAWRYILVPRERRCDLAEAFAQALLERDAGATLEQIDTAREKAYRAPFMFLVVVNTGEEESGIPIFERLISVGAGIQNGLLMAHSMGYGCGLTSGRSITSSRIATLFGLKQGEVAICFVNIGTVTKAKSSGIRRMPSDFLSSL